MALDTMQGPGTLAPEPAPPSRQFSFTDWQTNNPTAPPPGDRLDGEFDRTNASVTQALAWTGTTLNTDGTIRPGTVGEPQLVPGLFDELAQDIIDECQGSVDQAQSHAGAASVSAAQSAISMNVAIAQAAAASGSAGNANVSAAAAIQARSDAQGFSAAAIDAADQTSNDANHTTQDVVTSSKYAVLSMEWAEHMPDTIPPNILADMAITGEHWSSRWWAHRAEELVLEGVNETVCAVQAYWLGAYDSPPTVDLCGNPIKAGASYFNPTTGRVYVYDGAGWHDVVQPVPGDVQDYTFLPASAASVFTGPDYFGVDFVFNPQNMGAEVFLNGVRLVDTLDYTLGTNTVTLTGAIGAPNVLAVAVLAKVNLTGSGAAPVKLVTSGWVLNGTNTTFPMVDAEGTPLNPSGATALLVSQDGVIQQAGADYTISGSDLIFIPAPASDATIWAVVGI